MNQKRNKEEKKYYLINKNVMIDIKKEYYFEEIIFLLKKNNVLENDFDKNKDIYSIIKALSNGDLKKYLQIKDLKDLKRECFYSPSLKSIKNTFINNCSNTILIYDNFELIEKETINLFLDNLKGNESNYLNCILYDGKIIIDYPDNFNEKYKYHSVIGLLNEDNTFITEYVLIYKNKKEKYFHLNKIMYQLNKYLNNLQLFNNTQPIISHNYLEIGIIIKNENNDYYKQLNNNETGNNYSFNNSNYFENNNGNQKKNILFKKK